MSESKTEYHSTERELQTLARLELTLDEALSFDQPTPGETETYNRLMGTDYTLLELCLLCPLIDELREHVVNNRVGAAVGPLPEFAIFKKDLIEAFASRLNGNPYPGIGFSLGQAREILEWIKNLELDGTRESYQWLLSELRTRLAPRPKS